MFKSCYNFNVTVSDIVIGCHSTYLISLKDNI